MTSLDDLRSAVSIEARRVEPSRAQRCLEIPRTDQAPRAPAPNTNGTTHDLLAALVVERGLPPPQGRPSSVGTHRRPPTSSMAAGRGRRNRQMTGALQQASRQLGRPTSSVIRPLRHCNICSGRRCGFARCLDSATRSEHSGRVRPLVRLIALTAVVVASGCSDNAPATGGRPYSVNSVAMSLGRPGGRSEPPRSSTPQPSNSRAHYG